MGYLNMEKKWLFPLVISSLVCVFLLATSFNMGLVSSVNTINSIFYIFHSRAMTNQTSSQFAEAKVNQAPPPPARPPVPKFAYLISGSRGDLEKLWRTLHALYHPGTIIFELASWVEKHPLFAKVGNVYMNEKANMITYRGPTMVANTLHACAILLKRHKDWDWFINLSASDYPLVTQDDLLHTFSDLKREINFIEHTSRLGWKAPQRAMPLIIDPGLYQTNKSDIFWVAPKRNLPTAFKLFTGSAWMILSRAFVEYCIWGWDNLPRTLLMYYSNFVSSPKAIFRLLSAMLQNLRRLFGAAFARKFNQDTPVLDKIDTELLGRKNGSFTPGGWCRGKPRCSKVGNPTKLRPGPGADRLRLLIDKLLSANLNQQQCT
ncbi:hypothetical protein Pfo_014117 [Paulownia fortunei]|nr:hypothetical protein Pfo_014117 [Paulownia fortunei]